MSKEPLNKSPGEDRLNYDLQKNSLKTHTKIENYFFDYLSRNLTITAQIIYLHLYRLSHGVSKSDCKVGKKTLTEKTSLSKNTVTKALKELKEKNYIKEVSWDQNGTIFQVLTPEEIFNSINGIPYYGIPKNNTIENPFEKREIEEKKIIIENSGIPDNDIPKFNTPKEDIKQEGIYLDEHYNSLSEKEKMIIEKQAIKELSETNPQFNNKNLTFMKDFLIKMKIREIVRINYFT